MKRFRWGIFGTGEISGKFVLGLKSVRNVEISLIASRSIGKAKIFAKKMGVSRAIAGYTDAIAAGGVDAFYIATPPSEHTRHALLCIEAGIPVLVEKPFATSGEEALMIADAARSKSVFAMEAMWTRFLPATKALKKKLSAGKIGEVRLVSGNFGVSESPAPENGSFNPTLGGGVMSQLGVYPLSLAQWLFGSPQKIQAMGSVGATGVDEDAAFSLQYPGGVTGSFYATLRAWAPNNFDLMGTEGMIRFTGPIVRPYGLATMHKTPICRQTPNFGWPFHIRQHALIHRLAQVIGLSPQRLGKRLKYYYAGNGYHYEAEEVRSCIARGAIESDVVPLDDSVSVASTADFIRKKILNSRSSGSDPA